MTGGSLAAQAGPAEEVVVRYLRCMTSMDFVTAHELLTEDMTGGLDAWSWAIRQKQAFKRGGIEFYGFDTYVAKVEDDHAIVPNVLFSRDRIINKKGVPEYELYVLVRRDGRWLIDRQKLAKNRERETLFVDVAHSERFAAPRTPAIGMDEADEAMADPLPRSILEPGAGEP